LTQDNDAKAVDGYAAIMKDNIQFCKSNKEAGDAYTELTGFMRDVFSTYTAWEKTLPRERFGRAVASSAMLTYLSFVLQPLCYGIFYDFLGGNLMASFMQARALLELLAKCYLADTQEIEPGHNGFFQNRLAFIENSRKITELIKSLGSDSFELYGELSAHWVHMARLGKLVNAVSERHLFPTYGIIVPINYGEQDIPDIIELTQCVKKLRELVIHTVESWEISRRFPSSDI
jgi:hypothetical protein